MPFAYTCSDHPGWKGSVIDDATSHIRSDHPGHHGRPDREPLRCTFTRQEVAQGGVTRYRFHCRRCAAPIDTTTRPDPDAAYCEDCK